MSYSDSIQEILVYREKIAKGEYVSIDETPVCFWGKFQIRQKGYSFPAQTHHTKEAAEIALIWWNEHNHGELFYIYESED